VVRRGAQAVVDAFLDQTQWRPALTALVAGALPYTRYGFWKRFLMKRIARSHGDPIDTSRDHELTDWRALEAFARQAAALLGGGRAKALAG
jgi:menaquinone-dependent protoporphyrinogen oxidase